MYKKLNVQKVAGALRKHGIKRAECYKHNSFHVVVDPRRESAEDIKRVLVECEGLTCERERAGMLGFCWAV